MKRFVYALACTSVILACVGIAQSQARVDTTEARERQRQRQAAVENPANNPFTFEPYDRLKPGKAPEPSPLRATVELMVVGAADGDTLIIKNTAGSPVRLRIQGIDAPEQGQPYSNDAKAHLEKLVSGKMVSVEFDPHGKPDVQGRIVAKILVEGDDLAYIQIKAGFAWYSKEYKKLLSESDRYTYAETEKESRVASRGLWKDQTPVAPWNYRKQ